MLNQQQKSKIIYRFNEKAKDFYFEQLYLLGNQITFKEAKSQTYKLLADKDTLFSFFDDEENKDEIKDVMKSEVDNV